VAAVGWGATADQAAADAQRGRVVGELLAAEGLASRTFAHASAETSGSVRASALTDWIDAFGSAHDAARTAGLVCERGQVPADATVRWLPPDPDEPRDCGMDLIPATVDAGASPHALQDTVRDRCDVHRDLSHQMVADASANANADMRAVLVHAGWAVVDRCEAACLGHHRIPEATWTPVTLAGQPDRSTADAAVASVHAAAQAGDVAALFVALPWLDMLRQSRGVDPAELVDALVAMPLTPVAFRGQWLIAAPD
jgi:hypothetical protein